MKQKRNLKDCILFFILGAVICGTTIVVAESIQSSEITYNNGNAVSSSTDVQSALDELYETISSVGSGHSLIVNSADGLSSELVAGLYRYQGVQDATHNVNNYICFGTYDKNTCTSNVDNYMYRIVGINSNGQMKLLKNTSLVTHNWSSTTGGIWPESDLFIDLNGSYFLENENYIPNDVWRNKILTTNWKYGNVLESRQTAQSMANTELSLTNSINAKIGLLYLHDFYYGLPGNNNCSDKIDANTCRTSWIFLGLNEWTVVKNNFGAIYIYGPLNWDFGARWAISYSGEETNLYSVRPVFFLNSSEYIVSGSGTITDPYILR